jgi:hypothetical protein
MRVARLRVSVELIRQWLDLPEGSEILGVRDVIGPYPQAELIVEHPDFDDVATVEDGPIVTPEYRRDCPHVSAKFIAWGKQ